jgi:hypothetical protein
LFFLETIIVVKVSLLWVGIGFHSIAVIIWVDIDHLGLIRGFLIKNNLLISLSIE